MGSLKNNCYDFVNSGSSELILAGRCVWDATPWLVVEWDATRRLVDLYQQPFSLSDNLAPIASSLW